MPSTAEEVITFLINEDSYFFESFKYGLVSFNGFFFMFLLYYKMMRVERQILLCAWHNWRRLEA